MTLNESISDVRLHLIEPVPQKPNNRHVMLKLQDVAQLLHVEAINTSTAWEIQTTPLNVSANIATYLIPAPAFSKDVRIVTKDPANPFHVEREIRRCDLQDIDQFYQGPERSTTAGHSAAVMAFYRQGAGVWVKVVPTPADSREYEIWYEANLPDDVALGDAPNIQAFHRYRNLKAAIALIPFCDWSTSAELTAARMTMLAVSLSSQISDFEKAWRRYVTSDRQDGTAVRIGYGEMSGYDYW